MTTDLAELDVGNVRVVVATQTYSFDRFERLQDCLSMIFRNSRVPDLVVVVVDSNPELREHLQASDERVLVLESEGSGVARARNTALTSRGVAQADVVVFIDDDVVPSTCWLDGMVEVLCRPGVAAVGGRIVPEYEPGVAPLPDELLWVVGCTYAGHPIEPGPITRPIGATMGFRRKELLAVGGFDASFGPLGPKKTNSNEELALSQKLRASFGLDCIRYAPGAEVRHFVPASRCSWRYLVARSWVEGTSKAAVRQRARTHDVLDHDTSYVMHTLLPGVGRYLGKGRIRHSGSLVASGLAAAGGFGWRSFSSLYASCRAAVAPPSGA